MPTCLDVMRASLFVLFLIERYIAKLRNVRQMSGNRLRHRTDDNMETWNNRKTITRRKIMARVGVALE